MEGAEELKLSATCSGTNQSADKTLQLHESTGSGNLDLRTGSLLAGQLHSVRHGSFLALRVEQPPSVPCRIGRSGESVLCVQQFLVHHRYLPETRIRTQPQGSRPNRCYFCVHSFTATLDRGRDDQRRETHNKTVSCCNLFLFLRTSTLP